MRPHTLARHGLSHRFSGRKLHQCGICEKSYKEKYLLRYHERIHTGEKPFKCELCEKAFTAKQLLNQHKTKSHRSTNTESASNSRSLENQSSFLCEECGRSFKKRSHLASHQRSHSKIFQCEKCPKIMKWRYKLIAHERTHAGEKLFNCELCEEVFISEHLLCQHKTLKHSKTIPVAEATLGDLLTEKSRSLYLKCYANFKQWAADKKASLLSEDVFLCYFLYLSTKLKSSSLWSRYSMLRSTLNTNDNVDISQFKKLLAFLRKQEEGYSAKKCKVCIFHVL